MTIEQANDLTDDELSLLLFIINEINPIQPVKFIKLRDLTWCNHQLLCKKVIDSFPQLLPEAHATYTSLLKKMGIEIKITPQNTEVSGSMESGSIEQ